MSKSVDQANEWQRRYAIARDNQSPMFKQFGAWYDLFYATVTTTNIAPWRSKIFIPMITGKAWNLIAKFVGLKPGFEVSVRDDSSDDVAAIQDKADKMQKKLEFDYDNPNLDEPIRDKIMASLVDAVVTGTGIAKVPWCIDDDVRYERLVDPISGTVDLTKQKKITTKRGYNDLIPVNIFNVFVAPTATNLYSAPWLIIKEYKTLDELKKKEKNGQYKNIGKLEKARASADEFAQYKRSRNRLVSSTDPVTSDTTLDHIAVFECYSDGKIQTFAAAGSNKDTEGNWVDITATNGDNPYWHGKYPLVKFVVKQRPYDFWGEGIFEVTQRLQSAINDVFNHYMDNVNLSIDGMLMIDEGSNVNDYVVEPGGEITFRGTPPQQFKFPAPDPRQLDSVLQVIEKAIEDVTISSYATGLPSSSTDTTSGTATGIARLQAAAGDVISFMKNNFQQSINEIGRMWLSNNQQYFDQTLTLNQPSMTNPGPMQITPADLQGDMELKIDDASMEPVDKNEKRQSRMALNQQMLQLQQVALQQVQAGGQPLILDVQAVFEDTAEDFGEKNPEKYIVDPQEVAAKQAEMQQQQMMQQQNDQQAQMAQQQAQAQAQAQQQQADQQAKADQAVQGIATDLAASGHIHPDLLTMLGGQSG